MNEVDPARLAAVALDPAATAYAWLDGGREARGFFGVEAQLEIEDDDLAALARVDALWREDPRGVWMGWVTYDLGADALLGRPARAGSLPGLVARRYAAAWELEGKGPPEVHALSAAAAARLEAVYARADAQVTGARGGRRGAWPFGELRAHESAESYRARVRQAIEHIRAGDTYQVNLSQEFTAQRTHARRDDAREAVDAHLRLRGATPSTMGALMRVREGLWIVSNSPETLVRVDRASRAIASWPIKGTRPRHADPAADLAASEALLQSEKDAAEHVMIVDLVRNDLGRLAEAGSVRVVGPPQLVSLPTVHHLVSEVRATLSPDWSLPGIFDALFPGGSITGAPKRRTVEIIDALESGPRSIYCGAIFVLEPRGLSVSIPIRTALLGRSGLWLRSGGGIVVDSDPEQERLETLAKSRAFDP